MRSSDASRRAARVALLVVLAASVGAGCGRGGGSIDPRAADPAALGPFPVGVRTVPLDDPSREDLTARYPIPRRVTTEIWYPAAESARDDRRTCGEGERIDGGEPFRFIEPSIALPILNRTAVAFFRWTLKGDTAMVARLAENPDPAWVTYRAAGLPPG